MAKNTMNAKVNATMRTSKQQISKILMSQLTSHLENAAKYWTSNEDACTIKDHDIAYKIVKSRAFTNGCITSWSSFDFRFKFEYGRRKSVRVSYMNSDGLISAIFGEDEWICMCEFIEERLDRITEKGFDELAKKKAEQDQWLFDHKVKVAVEKALAERAERKEKYMDVHAMHSAKPYDNELM